MNLFSISTLDTQIRAAAFEWLTRQVDQHGEVLSRKLLADGFEFGRHQIPLVSPQGIFKPQQLEIPLSITTSPKGPYNDGYDKSVGYILYRYRGSDPNHRDNRGLRYAMQKGIPLVYFHGLIPGQYLAFWPVYVMLDNPDNLSFYIAVDDISSLETRVAGASEGALISDQQNVAMRQYITATVRKRVHQRSFRSRVLRAYREQCSLCRLRHLELLDAAHIIPDSNPEGEPVVKNGIALCKLHHAAFDSFIIGITPDFQVVVRKDILEEEDGPMLQHGLKELQSKKIILPTSKSNWPDRQFLEQRHHKFKQVG